MFFPIDGFKGINDENVRNAVDELEKTLRNVFKCETISGYVDKTNNEFEWNM